MVTRFCRVHRSTILAAFSCFWAWIGSAAPAEAQAAAQPLTTAWTATWPPLAGRLSIGDRIYVTDTAGATTAGTLTAVTDAVLEVKVGGSVLSLAAADVRRIQSREADSPLNGILIGAGFGAIPGIYWLVVDPNECTGLCPEDYAAIAVGALLGGLIDRAVTRKVTVYEAAESSSSARRLLIGPILSRKRSGLQLALRF
jgi:hypothetical protein